MSRRSWLLSSSLALALSFGGTAVAAAPSDARVIGALDAVTTSGPTGAVMTVTGWAQRTGSPESVQIHVYDFGPATTVGHSGFFTGLPRPDVVAVVGGIETAGYAITLPLTTGEHRVCAFGIGGGAAPNALLGCLSVTGPAAALGSLDVAEPVAAGVVRFAGWVVDPAVPDTTAQVAFATTPPYRAVAVADEPRPDVAAIFPWAGPNHGFTSTAIVGPGRQTVCGARYDEATGITSGNIGCRTVTMENALGRIDAVTSSQGTVTVQGWSIDPYNRNTASGLVVLAVPDSGEATVLPTGTLVARPDVNSVFGTTGTHGFSATFAPGALTPGNYTVSVYAEAFFSMAQDFPDVDHPIATATVTVG